MRRYEIMTGVVKPIVRIPQGSIDVKEEYFTGSGVASQIVTLSHIPFLPLIRVEKWDDTNTIWVSMIKDSADENLKYAVSGTLDSLNTIITFGTTVISSALEDNIHIVYQVNKLTINSELKISATDIVFNIEKPFSNSSLVAQQALVDTQRHIQGDIIAIGGIDQSGTDWSPCIQDLTDIALSVANIDIDTTYISDNTFALSRALKQVDEDELITRITNNSGVEINPATEETLNVVATDTANISDNTFALSKALKTVDEDEFISRLVNTGGVEINPATVEVMDGIATDTVNISDNTMYIKDNAILIKTAVQLIDDTVYTEGDTTPSKGILVFGSDGTYARALAVNADGELKVNLETADIEIGAVELKNGTDDTRATISSDGFLNALFVQAHNLDVRDTEVSDNSMYIKDNTMDIKTAVEKIDDWEGTGALADHLKAVMFATDTSGNPVEIVADDEGYLQVGEKKPISLIVGTNTGIPTSKAQIITTSTPILRCVTAKVRTLGTGTYIGFGTDGALGETFRLNNVGDSIDIDWMDNLNKVYVITDAGNSSEIEFIGG